MRGVVALIACTAGLAAMVGCEVLVGITGKTFMDASTESGTDAGEDASDVPDASVPCKDQVMPYLFCEDFDNETNVGQSWNYELVEGGATLQLDPTLYKTPPQSAAVTMPQQALAQLGLQGQQLTSGFSLGFDLFVGTADGGAVDLSSIPQVGIAQVYRTTGGHTSFDYVLGTPGQLCEMQIYDDDDNQTDVALQAPPMQKWTRITLVYDATQGLSVIEDGKVIGTPSTAVTGAPGSVAIIVGGAFSNPRQGAVPLTVEIDDVVLRGQ
jgi:hypothetical protein